MNSDCKLAFVHKFEFFDAEGNLVWCEEVQNLMPQVGINYVAGAMFGDTAPIGTFYIGLFQNNVLPTSSTTASDIPTTLGEFVGYSNSTRPLWNRSYDGIGSINNSASRAEFTITADARLYGGFLVSTSTKGGNTGLLLSVARFESPRDVTAGGTFRVTSVISLVPGTTS